MMVNELVMAVALTCMTPVIENHTQVWTETDQQVFESAKKGCARTYKDEAPCLKIFTKMDDTTYRVICGK